MAAVLALVVIEIGLIDLLAQTAANLAPDGSACHDANHTSDGGAKYSAGRACSKASCQACPSA